MGVVTTLNPDGKRLFCSTLSPLSYFFLLQRMQLLQSSDAIDGLEEDEDTESNISASIVEARSPAVILSPRDKSFRSSYYQKIGLVRPMSGTNTQTRNRSESQPASRSSPKAHSDPIPISVAGVNDEFFNSNNYGASVPVRALDVFFTNK